MAREPLNPAAAALKALTVAGEAYDAAPTLPLLDVWEAAQDAYVSAVAKQVKAQRASRKMAISRVPLMRPYDKSGENSRSKAVEYARWIAARDGREGATGAGVVFFGVRRWAAFDGWVCVAEGVTFAGGASIDLPNTSYDPTAPAVDLDAAPEVELLAA